MVTDVYSPTNIRATIEEAPIEWLRPSSLNPRTIFDEDQLRELAASIERHGILQPIVVREVRLESEDFFSEPPKPRYEIVAGHRRFLAAAKAGLSTVPIRSLGALDDNTSLELMLVENLQRTDLDPKGNWTARACENADNWPYQVTEKLTRTGCARRLSGYPAPEFDPAVCEKCPFEARHKLNHEELCFYPAHFDELQKAKLDATIAAAEASGRKVVELKGLTSDNYTTLWNAPSTCIPACPCRAVGIRENGQVVDVCLDPKRMKGLQRAATKEENRPKNEAKARERARLDAALAAISEVGAPELAILIHEILSWDQGWQALDGELKRLGIVIADDGYKWSRKPRIDRVAAIEKDGARALADPVTLVRAAVRGILRGELDDYYGQRGNVISKPRVDWYLAQRPAEAEAAALADDEEVEA